MNLAAYAVVPLVVMTVVAAVTVAVVTIALRGSAPQDRAGILRAVADLIHAVWRTR